MTALLVGLAFAPGVAGAADPVTTPAPTPQKPKFDITLEDDGALKSLVKIERTGPARDFINNTAIYLRFIPVKQGDKVHPVFIQDRNYLTCPKSDKKYPLNDVKQIDNDKRRGIKMYGFFFQRPECDDPTFHMSAVSAQS
jgi:hypothetical protein